MSLFSKNKSGSATDNSRSARFRSWTRRTLVAILIAVAVTAAFYLSRPHYGPGRLDLALRDLFAKVPWYYVEIDKAEARARRSGRTSWVPGVLARHAARAEFQGGQLRSQARMELIAMGKIAWPAIPALMNALHERDPSIRVMAADVLAKVKANESPIFEKLKPGLKDDERAAQAFRWLLKGNDEFGRPYDRRFALMGLAACGPAARVALPEMLELAQGKQQEGHDLRVSALAAIDALGSEAKGTLPALKQIIRDPEEWPEVRAAAVSATAAIAPNNADLIALLQPLLADERSLVRIAAANALIERVPPDALLPILTNALSHKLPTIRRAALDALARLGRPARPARPAIENLLSDENESVREAAKEILEKLQK